MSLVKEHLAYVNETADSLIIESYCAIFQYVHELCTGILLFPREVICDDVFALIDSLVKTILNAKIKVIFDRLGASLDIAKTCISIQKKG